jgi:hypothetical protein
MAVKHPIQYELTPTSTSIGLRWLTLTIENIGTENLIGLDVKLNSLDAYDIYVYGTSSFIQSLKPDEKQVIPFQALINATDWVYISLDGWKGAEIFHWESPRIRMKVGEDVATLVSLFALTQPYARLGERIKVEATLQGATESEELRLEFWAETPGGEFVQLGTVKPKNLGAGEEVRYAVEMMPQHEGKYTIYAYLYDGAKRIGHELEHIRVTDVRSDNAAHHG